MRTLWQSSAVAAHLLAGPIVIGRYAGGPHFGRRQPALERLTKSVLFEVVGRQRHLGDLVPQLLRDRMPGQAHRILQPVRLAYADYG